MLCRWQVSPQSTAVADGFASAVKIWETTQPCGPLHTSTSMWRARDTRECVRNVPQLCIYGGSHATAHPRFIYTPVLAEYKHSSIQVLSQPKAFNCKRRTTRGRVTQKCSINFLFLRRQRKRVRCFLSSHARLRPPAKRPRRSRR